MAEASGVATDRTAAAGTSAAGGRRPPGQSRVDRRVWLASFACVLVSMLLWALASPLFSGPDEPAHAVYSAGAVRGELFQEASGITTRLVEVPRDLQSADGPTTCFAFDANQSAACAPEYGLQGSDIVEVSTSAGRYPPAYYLVAGVPTLVLDGKAGVYAMRAVTALVTAALLASAVVSGLARSATPWPLLAVLVATTPMVLFISAVVNPQGPEIAAGALMWSAGLALLGRSDSGVLDLALERRLVLRVLVAASVLAVVRPLAPLWLLLGAGLIVLAAARGEQLRRLVRQPLALVGGAVVFLLTLATSVYVVLADALLQQPGTTYADMPTAEALLYSGTRADDLLAQMVGVFGWLDTYPPAFVHLGWVALLGLLVFAAAAGAGRRGGAALLLLVVLGTVLPVLLEVSAYRESGFGWQGRYTLPLLVGVPILAGHLLERQRVGAFGNPGRVATVVLAVMVVCHVGAFVGALNRYVRGADMFWFQGPAEWQPPLGSAVLILAFALVMAGGAVGVRRVLPAGAAPGAVASTPSVGRPHDR